MEEAKEEDLSLVQTIVSALKVSARCFAIRHSVCPWVARRLCAFSRSFQNRARAEGVRAWISAAVPRLLGTDGQRRVYNEEELHAVVGEGRRDTCEEVRL